MKIAIVTLPLHTNYGGILQAYALQQVLQGMGHEVYVIDEEKHFEFSLKRRIEMFAKGIIKRCLQGKNAIIYSPEYYKRLWEARTMHTGRFINEHINRRLVRNVTELGENDFGAFVVGSDQIWRARYANPFPGIENAFLRFTKGWNVRRIAYAVSFGTDKWEYNKNESQHCALMANMFDAISVRETSGVALCKEYLGVEAINVIDPTLLLGTADYVRLITKDTPTGSGNLMCYFLDKNQEKENLIDDVAKVEGMIPFSTNVQTENHKISLENRIQPSVEQWLQSFHDARFVLTDSFHACIFSILFQKPFIVFGSQNRGMTRLESLLQMFGLENRMVSSYEEYKQRRVSLLSSIDYECVFDLLEEKRDEAIKFLQEALG